MSSIVVAQHAMRRSETWQLVVPQSRVCGERAEQHDAWVARIAVLADVEFATGYVHPTLVSHRSVAVLHFSGLPDSLENRRVVRYSESAHVEYARSRCTGNLDCAGRFTELHRRQCVHRDARSTDRMSLGLEAAADVDRQATTAHGPAFVDRDMTLPRRRQPH